MNALDPKNPAGPSRTYRRVLVPDDLTEAGTVAARRAASIALDTGAVVTLLHVETATLATLAGPRAPIVRDRAERVVALLRERGANLGLPRGSMFVQVEEGDPATTIIAQARSHDLVVLSSRGVDSVNDAVFGTLSARVMRDCAVDVLLVRPRRPHRTPQGAKPAR